MTPRSHPKASDARSDAFSTMGIVIPAEWNEHGEPVGMALSTYGEETYIVDSDNEPGKAIQRMVRRKVRVEGTIYRMDDGREAIRIQRFELQEPWAEEGSEPTKMTLSLDPPDSSRT